MKHFKKTDLAWAAGIIDADGYMGICGEKHKLADGSKKLYPQLRVTVSNYDIPMVNKLHELFGGTRCAYPKPDRRKLIQRWEVAAKKAERTLKVLLPYLVTKEKQAVLAISFRENRFSKKDSEWVRLSRSLKI